MRSVCPEAIRSNQKSPASMRFRNRAPAASSLLSCNTSVTSLQVIDRVVLEAASVFLAVVQAGIIFRGRIGPQHFKGHRAPGVFRRGIQRVRTAVHDHQRIHLKAKFEGLDALHGANLAVEEGLRKATMLTRTLLTCPVCREQANPHSFEQTGSLFRCECPSCSAVWGRRTCAGCTEAFAFIDFIGNEPSQELLGADRRYGADVLALPVDEDVFVCPHCGLRSDGEPHG